MCKQNVIAIYCLVVFVEEDDLGDRDSEEEESVEVEGLILKL